MNNTDTNTIEKIIPDNTARAILMAAMEKTFPDERESIEQHLRAFAIAVVRCSQVEVETRRLQRYFCKTCWWSEFQAIWYRARIDHFIEIARTNRKLENRGE